jgi:hypothetical protein
MNIVLNLNIRTYNPSLRKAPKRYRLWFLKIPVEFTPIIANLNFESETKKWNFEN